ncbi:hypothetical protein CGZ93_05395 [Enemella dayhoffiae]|uniref:SDR family NAD(P)-dependent oxidoreductase n=1 Tax=Enemella dayhoffiae TaxID=2016507 RepID=A0A255H8K9_9ACTN|nr:hypothetical protein [Enemella dayhoffiae]OYO23945.1 hypothetical protein CGZ93_05395 [Enemella dayhoffiae]
MDLHGTGVRVTEVAPGPVRTGFDAAAGLSDGMDTGLPESVVIDAEQCAREAMAGLEAGAPLGWPGRGYRALMWVTQWLPRPLARAMFASSGRTAADH